MFIAFRAITYATLFIGLALTDLSSGARPGLVGHCAACGDSMAAGCGDHSRERRRSGGSMVRIHFRIDWERHASAL